MQKMIEILIAFLLGFGVGLSGYWWLPARNVTNLQNVEQRQEQKTEVFQGQITVVISDKHGITNFNINISGVTNITYYTNYSVTNLK